VAIFNLFKLFDAVSAARRPTKLLRRRFTQPSCIGSPLSHCLIVAQTCPKMNFDLSTSVLLAITLVVLFAWMIIFNKNKSANAPGIGYGPLPVIGAWKGIYTFMKDPQRTMAEGCRKYRGGYFRVSTHAVEYLMVTDKEKIAEYLAAPEEVLSFHDMIQEFLQVEWTLGYGVAHRPYHIPLVRTKLTQTIANNVPSMLSEIQEAIRSLIGTPNGKSRHSCESSVTYYISEWTKITLYKAMVGIVARVSNNAFSGLEFCKM
jgi:hypothetical protein